MKIGYYLGSASLRGGGVAPYAWRLLDLLLNHEKDYNNINTFVLCDERIKKECLDLINSSQSNAKVIVIKDHTFNYVERINRRIGIFLSKASQKFNVVDVKLTSYFNPRYRWFTSLDIDLLYVPYQVAPVYDVPYPFIVTMHDVQELHFPEFFTPEQRTYRAEHYWKSLKYASSVIVSFDHVKQDLIKYFNLPESKVFVCPLPYNQIKLASPTEHEASKYAEKYDNLECFILYPAQTWQHKNHLSLIKAIELIKAQHQRSINLICTGKKNSFFNEAIEKYLINSPISKQIQFMDIVPETELYWLYKKCALVVVPTLYEAGSFPLLEAMSLDVPVICSSVTSLPETIGDSRFVFDPLDINEMSQLILAMLKSAQLRQDNIKNSQDRIKKLSEVNSFKFIYDAWCKSLSKKFFPC